MNLPAGHDVEPPIIGGIYSDESERSFAFLNVSNNIALLEYADGTLATVELHHWQQLRPRQAMY